MRILFTIPHFYRPKSAPDGAEPLHGSGAVSADRRVVALARCVLSLCETFGSHQSFIGKPTTPCNGAIASQIDIVVCTTGNHHLIDRLPPDLFRHHSTFAEPMFLGYSCHQVLADNLGRYDYYCFLEDDIVVSDPLFFWKQAWFTRMVGDRALLQPHRFETSDQLPRQKLYIDGPIRDPTIAPKFQDKHVRPRMQGRVMGVEIAFERVDNPHSGCFFLTEAQMRRWADQPYFLDRSAEFWGPLESAATLGVMRTFETYKPALENAGFLEVHHLDTRYLGRAVWPLRPQK